MEEMFGHPSHLLRNKLLSMHDKFKRNGFRIQNLFYTTHS